MRMMRVLSSTCILAVGIASGSASATTMYSNDFDGNVAAFAGVSAVAGGGAIVDGQGYKSNPLTQAAGFAGNLYRGVDMFVTLSGLPAHTTLDLGFLFARIDSWDGFNCCGPDIIEIALDGNVVLSNQPIVTPINQIVTGVALGFNVSWTDGAHDFLSLAALTGLAHSGSTATIRISLPNGQGLDDESIGVDNFFVATNFVPPPQVPEPTTLGLLGLGLAGLGLSRRRKAA